MARPVTLFTGQWADLPLETLAEKAASFAAGKSEGLQEAKASIEASLNQLLEGAGKLLADLVRAEGDRETSTYKMATQIALNVTRKVLPGLAAKNNLEEIETTIAHAIETRHDEPRMVIRVHQSVLDPLRERIDAVASQHGFTGQLILMDDENLQPTDCRIEWAEGGTEKFFDMLYNQIESTLMKSSGIDAIAEETVAVEEPSQESENSTEPQDTPAPETPAEQTSIETNETDT